MSAKRYRKKEEFTAMQWDGKNEDEIVNALPLSKFGSPEVYINHGHLLFYIPLLEGCIDACEGDWIVSTEAEEIYSVTAKRFPSMFEEVSQ
jgi:hypothetical protein